MAALLACRHIGINDDDGRRSFKLTQLRVRVPTVRGNHSIAWLVALPQLADKACAALDIAKSSFYAVWQRLDKATSIDAPPELLPILREMRVIAAATTTAKLLTLPTCR